MTPSGVSNGGCGERALRTRESMHRRCGWPYRIAHVTGPNLSGEWQRWKRPIPLTSPHMECVMAAKDLTAERLREVLSYDMSTGLFAWAQTKGCRAKKGSAAGSLLSAGYVCIRIDRCTHRAHRLAWLWVTGSHPHAEIDHINGVRSDNRFSNLREAARGPNSQNQRRAHSNSKSGLLGVSWEPRKRKWRATITAGKKTTELGCFMTKEQAYSVYLDAKRRLHETCEI